jgi:ABC-type Fe3+-hydroxamate transport system substrate-binding protein
MQIVRLMAAALALAVLCSCSGSHPAREARSLRIVTLVPSMAEDLFAIGAGPQVVGVSAFTDDIPAATSLPQVADFSSIDSEKIVALRADVAVGIPSQDRMVDALRRAGVRVVLLPDDSYADIFNTIKALGALTGRAPAADALIARLRARAAHLQLRTASFTRHPSIFVALGAQPIWTVGTSSYIGTLIAMAGGRNAAADLPVAWGEYSAEALLRAQPDAIVTDRDTHLETVLGREPWRSLRAVRAHHVYVVEPVAILERPGPRYTEGLQWLIERLTPLATAR